MEDFLSLLMSKLTQPFPDIPPFRRPIMQGPSGDEFSEISITVDDPRLNDGKPTLIPSVFGGRVRGQDEAINLAVMLSQMGKKWPSFNSFDEANEYARARSGSLDYRQR